jgi:hypothetical protein
LRRRRHLAWRGKRNHGREQYWAVHLPCFFHCRAGEPASPSMPRWATYR